MNKPEQTSPAYGLLRRVLNIAVGPVGTVLLAMVALIAGVATYAAFSGLAPDILPYNSLPTLVLADAAIVVILSCLIAFRLVSILMARRRGKAGARLHVRMVLLFALMAVMPTVVVATFIGYSLNATLQEVFSERIRNALSDAKATADRYLADQQNAFEESIVPFAVYLRGRGAGILLNQQELTTVLSKFMASSDLIEVAVVDRMGSPIARGLISPSAREFIRPPLDRIQNALSGQPQLLTQEPGRVSALLRISQTQEIFLYASQRVDPQLLSQVNRLRGTLEEYGRLEEQRTPFQLRLAAILVIIMLVVLLLAVWIGILYATKLSEPISALIGAAERVRGGDLGVRVNEPRTEDELGVLSRAFNRMTGQLAEQRQDLVAANRQLDERSRFTEAVLAGVSSAVISLNAEGEVELANRAAHDLFGVGTGDLPGFSLADRLPGLAGLLELSRVRPSRIAQEELEFRRNGETRTLLTRVTAEQFTPGEGGRSRLQGFVVTFDDVTDLLSAQRKAAWADVARRIAHEIKNPLTPIQLSAERLKRKALKQIVDDPATFAICTDTIIRQVGDIGRMVDEFSSFARMPRPVLQSEDIKEICSQALFLQRNAQPQIVFTNHLPDHPVELPCDRRQIGQALTNLLKNAGEAIEGRPHSEGQNLPQGEISMRMEESDDKIAIIVEDNGKGLPQEERSRLTEPYVTTRAKGTGLGLAIVKKIMEDHGGYLLLEDREGGGARVSLVFLRSQTAALAAHQLASAQQQTPPFKTAHGA
jgi:two-component system nitrogen regulation sensor histidine kinase NtrY